MFLEVHKVFIRNNTSPFSCRSSQWHFLRFLSLFYKLYLRRILIVVLFYNCVLNNNRCEYLIIINNRFLIKNNIPNVSFTSKLNILEKYCISRFKNWSWCRIIKLVSSWVFSITNKIVANCPWVQFSYMRLIRSCLSWTSSNV